MKWGILFIPGFQFDMLYKNFIIYNVWQDLEIWLLSRVISNQRLHSSWFFFTCVGWRSFIKVWETASLFKSPPVSRTLLSILADHNNSLVRMVLCSPIFNSFRPHNKPLRIVPSAPLPMFRCIQQLQPVWEPVDSEVMESLSMTFEMFSLRIAQHRSY